MAAESRAIQPPLTRSEAGTLLGQTTGPVAVTAGLFALGAYFGGDVAHQWGWLFFVGSLLLPEVAAEHGHPGGTASRRFNLLRRPQRIPLAGGALWQRTVEKTRYVMDSGESRLAAA